MARILLLALLLSGWPLSLVYANASAGVSVRTDTTAPANATLRLILDSLRKQPTIKGVRIKLQDINFETNSAVLTPGSIAYVDTIAAVLNKIPALILEIGGHTDNVGGAQRNQLLSQNRAQAVRSRLVGAPGLVSGKRVTFRGYSETRPVASNASETGRLLNRRVEMQFVGLDNTLTTKVYLRSGRIIRAAFIYINGSSVLYKTDENSPVAEVSCAEVLRLVHADGRIQVPDCPQPAQVAESPLSAQTTVTVRKTSKVYLLPTFGANYMMGEKPVWTSKTAGYAHVLGFGGSALVGYRLSERFAIGLQTGYWRWSTRVEYKESESGPVLRQYNSDATQVPLYLCLPFYLTPSVYLMPEAGVNLLKINAGFDESREKFSGIQTGYGLTLGYSTNRQKAVWADFGLVYRAHQQASWNRQYAVPAMHYIGLKLGFGFSL